MGHKRGCCRRHRAYTTRYHSSTTVPASCIVPGCVRARPRGTAFRVAAWSAPVALRRALFSASAGRRCFFPPLTPPVLRAKKKKKMLLFDYSPSFVCGCRRCPRLPRSLCKLPTCVDAEAGVLIHRSRGRSSRKSLPPLSRSWFDCAAF